MRTRPKKGSRTLAPDPAELVAPDRGDVVTRLRSIGTDGTTVSVIVGNKSVAKIDASDLEQLEVAAGAEWTTDLAGQLFDAAAKLAARKHALRLVAARPRARADLIRRLRMAGHADRHAAAAADAHAHAATADGGTDTVRSRAALGRLHWDADHGRAARGRRHHACRHAPRTTLEGRDRGTGWVG